MRLSKIEQRLAELERRQNNIIRVGIIDSADYEKARLKVTIGNLLTGWLPWMTARANNDKSWWAPEIGEQVLVLSPSGELAQGFVLPAIYQSAFSAPENSADIHITEYKDGTKITHNRATNKLTVDAVGDVEIIAALSVKTTSPIIELIGATSIKMASPLIELTGANIVLTGAIGFVGPVVSLPGAGGGGMNLSGGDIVVDGISVKNHDHQGDSGGTTGKPQ